MAKILAVAVEQLLLAAVFADREEGVTKPWRTTVDPEAIAGSRTLDDHEPPEILPPPPETRPVKPWLRYSQHPAVTRRRNRKGR